MWCTTCRQEVPGAASPSDADGRTGPMCCVRCGTVLLPMTMQSDAATDETSAVTVHDLDRERAFLHDINPLESFDTWALDEQLRHVERILAGPRFNLESSSVCGKLRIDKSGQSPSALSRFRGRKAVASLLSWAGLAVFTCGAALSGWSIVGGLDDLWPIGMPLAFGGLLCVLVGVIWQVEITWLSQFDLVSDLNQIDRRLGDLAHQFSPARRAQTTTAGSPSPDEGK
jgi:hypothetical protein